MMARIDWMKLWHDTRTDPKLRLLSAAEFRAWLMLLLYASEQDERGVVDLSDPDEVCLQCGFTDESGEPCVPLLDAVTDALVKRRLAVIMDDALVFPAFEGRQYPKPSDRPESVRRRVTKHRETRCNAMKRDETHREEEEEEVEEEQEGDGEKSKRENARELSDDTKTTRAFAAFPPCLSAPVILDGVTASGTTHIMKTGEELYGFDWAQSSKRNALAAMIADGCLDGCTASPEQAEECAVHILEKMIAKHKGTWDKSRALLRTCLVNDREQVRL